MQYYHTYKINLHYRVLLLFLFVLVSSMVNLFNIHIDNLVLDHTIQYQNAKDNFLDEVNKKLSNIMKTYEQKVDEQYKILRMHLILFNLILPKYLSNCIYM